jgi:hypothetical protein
MLMEIGPMRPGSLTRQYKEPQHHTGAYWQMGVLSILDKTQGICYNRFCRY